MDTKALHLRGLEMYPEEKCILNLYWPFCFSSADK